MFKDILVIIMVIIVLIVGFFAWWGDNHGSGDTSDKNKSNEEK